MPDRILFVCLGNICRSPTAQSIWEARTGRAADSAGTAAWHVGNPPDRRSVAAAKARSYDLSGQRARRVIAADFHLFDLIVAMDRDNLAVLEKMAPKGSRARIALMRDYDPEAPGADVPDPYFGSDGFHEVIDILERSIDGLIAAEQGTVSAR